MARSTTSSASNNSNSGESSNSDVSSEDIRRGRGSSSHDKAPAVAKMPAKKAAKSGGAAMITSSSPQEPSGSSRNTDGRDRANSPVSYPVARRPTDILCGRGIPIQTYPGNIRLHEIVNEFRKKYQETPRQRKPLVIKEIVQKAKDGGGRFLRRLDPEKEGDFWEEVDDDFAYQKVSHALRNQKYRSERKEKELDEQLRLREKHGIGPDHAYLGADTLSQSPRALGEGAATQQPPHQPAPIAQQGSIPAANAMHLLQALLGQSNNMVAPQPAAPAPPPQNPLLGLLSGGPGGNNTVQQQLLAALLLGPGGGNYNTNQSQPPPPPQTASTWPPQFQQQPPPPPQALPPAPNQTQNQVLANLLLAQLTGNNAPGPAPPPTAFPAFPQAQGQVPHPRSDPIQQALSNILSGFLPQQQQQQPQQQSLLNASSNSSVAAPHNQQQQQQQQQNGANPMAALALLQQMLGNSNGSTHQSPPNNGNGFGNV